MADDPAEAPTLREGHSPKAERPSDEHARYKPVREIARGGMGRVVEAIDTQLSRTVAVKEILDTHPDARARFEREVEITARLEHPSIVPLYDSGTASDGSPFYVMRKVGGEPLDAKIRAATTLDQRLRLLPNVLALGDAVAHAHARGVIHRDIKPNNVLVGALGETIVIDWGLAKLIGERDEPIRDEPVTVESLRTVAGTVFGTPGFMAPEQLAGAPLDERADVYALGACLYHVLAGKSPARDAAPPPLASIVSGVPTDLLTIVEKAMAREKTDRYLDAGGFSEDLRRFLNGQLVAAHHYPLYVRALRWLRRHRAVVAVVALAVAILVVIGVWSLRRVFAEQARAEAALAREHARADDLLVFKASTYIDTDPTLAAATLQQLAADSPLWSTLGPLVATIRARGVAYGYPSTGARVRFIEPSPRAGDTRVLVSSPGVVRIHDLALHTTTVLADDRQVWRARWCGTRVVIIRRQSADTFLDATSRAIDKVPWPETATEIECADDGSAIWLDGGKLHTHDGRTADVPADTTSLEISRSGKWITAASNTRVVVLHELREVFAVDIAEATVAIDAADRRIAIGGKAEVLELDLTQSPPTIHRRWREPVGGLLTYVGTDLHRWRVEGEIDRFTDDGPKRFLRYAGTLPEADVSGRAAIIEDPRTIAISSLSERYTIRTPEAVDGIAATRDGRYLIAAGSARVLAWDLSEILATRSTVSAGDALAFIGERGLVGLRQDGDKLRSVRSEIGPDLAVKELATGAQPALSNVHAYSDGLVLVFDPTTKRATIVEPVRTDVDVPNITAVTPADDTRSIFVATTEGAIHRIDRATGRPLRLEATLDIPVASLAARAGTLLALGEDDRIWRRDANGRESRAKVPQWLSSSIAPDGHIFIARDHDLLAWDAGDPTTVASFPQKLRGLRIATRDEVVLEVDGGALYRFDRNTRAITQLLPSSQWSAFTESGAAAIDEGVVTVLATRGEQVRLVEQLTLHASGLALSPDGRTVVAAVATPDRGAILHAWRLSDVLPRTWTMRVTNAVAPATSNAPTTWRP